MCVCVCTALGVLGGAARVGPGGAQLLHRGKVALRLRLAVVAGAWADERGSSVVCVRRMTRKVASGKLVCVRRMTRKVAMGD